MGMAPMGCMTEAAGDPAQSRGILGGRTEMSDIFISYAREDYDAAQRLAEALGGRGWSVWWDRTILAGEHFEKEIREALHKARCVVVLWSPHSIRDSDFLFLIQTILPPSMAFRRRNLSCPP